MTLRHHSFFQLCSRARCSISVYPKKGHVPQNIAITVDKLISGGTSTNLDWRDVQPANILLSADLNSLKITDFGTSKVIKTAAMMHTGFNSGNKMYRTHTLSCFSPISLSRALSLSLLFLFLSLSFSLSLYISLYISLGSPTQSSTHRKPHPV
jgi:serine/threonine protein kinase